MDKNEEKIKYLLAHINEGKTTDELNSDFEKWYHEECIVRRFNDRVETLKQAERKFKEFEIHRGGEYDYDKVCMCRSNDVSFSRSILLKDFVVAVQLHHADTSLKQHIHVDIFNKSMGGYLGSIKFDNMCEMANVEESENLLMKYGEHHIAIYGTRKVTDHGPYNTYEYRILISDTPMPDMKHNIDREYLRNKRPLR